MASDGYHSAVARSHLSPVATCRQTVDASLATVHRLAADGYDSAVPVATCRQTVEASLATPHLRLAADDYDSAVPVATCRQTVEAYLASPPSTAWQRMATTHPVATCRQTVEATSPRPTYLAPPTTAWQRMATWDVTYSTSSAGRKRPFFLRNE